MICINCSNPKTSVTNSRQHKKTAVWRRRYCVKCLITFTTYETPSLTDEPIVILGQDPAKKASPVDFPQKHQSFNRGKLIISIARAFTHSPESIKTDALYLAKTIEGLLLAVKQSRGVLTAADIAQTSYEVLKRYDELAALQYAAQHKLITNLRRRGRPSFGA